MSLRLALLLIGLVFIGVIVFTTLRRKHHHNPHRLGEQRDEPALHVPKAFHPVTEPDEQPDAAIGDAFDFASIDSAAGEEAVPHSHKPAKPDRAVFDINTCRQDMDLKLDGELDEQLDHVAYIKSGRPVLWSLLEKQVFPVLAEFEESANTIELVGQSTFGNIWYNVARHQEIGKFGNLALRMPLLNQRREPAASDFRQLDVAAETIAGLLGRRVSVPGERLPPQERAEELAAFYRDYKFVLYVHILARPGKTFLGKDLQRLFLREKLQYDGGFYHKVRPGTLKETLFSVADLYQPGKLDDKTLKSHSTGGLTLFFSVPMVKHPSRVLIDMLKMADVLATGLQGQMHDPDFNEVSVDMLEATSEELRQMEEVMQEFGIPAGSDTARRLFSR